MCVHVLYVYACWLASSKVVVLKLCVEQPFHRGRLRPLEKSYSYEVITKMILWFGGHHIRNCTKGPQHLEGWEPLL